MNNRLKESKLPRSPFELYLRFYWKTKRIQCEDAVEKSFEEASKTWFSLVSYEKMKFINKYKDLQNKYKKQVALHLKTAQPYMKKKLRTSEQLFENDDKNETGSETQSKAELPIEDNQWLNKEQPNNFLEADIANSNENISTMDKEEVTFPTENHFTVIVSEPEPPKIKSGRQLYELIQRKNSTYCLWNQLSAQEKKKYQAAVLTLKKEYINNLKLYLENLPSNELFKAYCKYC